MDKQQQRPLEAAAERLRRPPGRPRETQITTLPDPVADHVRRLFDLPSASAYLGISPWTTRDLEANGVLRRVRVPTGRGGELKKLLFARDDLDRCIEAWKDGGPA